MDTGIVTILIGTAAVGAALATLIVRLIRGVEKQIDTLRDDVRELRQEQAGLRTGYPSSATGYPGSKGSSRALARPSPGGTPPRTERPAAVRPARSAVSS